METRTFAQLKGLPADTSLRASVDAQFIQLLEKIGRDQRPYYEAAFADATAAITFRIWSDAPELPLVRETEPGECVRLEAEFHLHPTYGLAARSWRLRPLTPDERLLLLAGPSHEQQAADYAAIAHFIDSFQECRLRALCHGFLRDFGDRFRRTGAARQFHHARRGGLVEHVAQMMRDADALCTVRPQLNRDLLLAGILFHDAGKLWENAYEETGFTMPFQETAELLGHIAMGAELVGILWRQLESPEWSALQPASERVRRHLQHLILSHHGELAFGSPVVPKTPEAIALHYLDNLDAKLEMFTMGYATAPLLAPHVQERVRPLTGHLVTPLPHPVVDE